MIFDKIFRIYFLGSVIALLGAYVSQYFFDMRPCILCLYQRIPFFVVIFFVLLAMVLKSERASRYLVVASVLAFFVNSGVALYHVGIENKVFELTEKCEDGGISEVSSVEELKKVLAEQSLAKCDEPQFVLLGVSMAGWNFLYCFILGVLGVVFVRRNL